ncbi:hypothetical protein E4T52_10151 [Aureobasidium sp. EXF-3400]|nr:hypothetical protein E4T51_09165 [Aureobasidium sp. EXF-12344]KAI4774908.1 hypothetical protein E4T52_10151 [Aureobasidium sp. EXF-3400]
MSYSYATAKAVLSDVDKDRILAMHFSSDGNDQVDWDKATQAYGAASVNSMKVSYRNILTKIEKAGGKTDVTAPFAGADGSAPSTPKTPKTTKGKGRPPKRKAEDTGSDEDEDAPKSLRKKAAKNLIKAEDDDEDEVAPKSIRKKFTKSIVRADDEDEDDDETHKTPKKAGRPRKTPVKSKTAMSKAVEDDEEDAADNTNVISDKVEAAQEDEETSEVIKEEDQSEV